MISHLFYCVNVVSALTTQQKRCEVKFYRTKSSQAPFLWQLFNTKPQTITYKKVQKSKKFIYQQTTQLQYSMTHGIVLGMSTWYSSLYQTKESESRIIMATLLLRGERNRLACWIGRQCHFEILFKVSRDGCDATEFHRLCDNKGATVTILYNKEGSVFGGYTSQSWDSSENYISDDTAFLFQLRRNSITRQQKFPIKPEKAVHAIYCESSYGPTFGGGHDILTFVDTLKRTKGQNNNYFFELNGEYSYGESYSMNDEDANSIHNGHLNVTDLEVYRVLGKVPI